MAKSSTTKTSEEKRSEQSGGKTTEPVVRSALIRQQADIMALQDSAGNQSVHHLLQDVEERRADEAALDEAKGNQTVDLMRRASQGTGRPLEDSVRRPVEQQLKADLGRVRVHGGPAAEAAAESLAARAYTVGSDIYLGPAASQMSEQGRRELLAHEAVHAVQQGGQPVALQGSLPVSQPADPAEGEARQVAQAVTARQLPPTSSPTLGLRAAMRATPVAPTIQRDITGKAKVGYDSEFEINFKKKEGKVAGDFASEVGTIKFTPGRWAPESNSIKFVQIVRTFDTAAGDEFDWTGSAEANRNKMRTKRDRAKNIAPGFYVDQIAASLAKRTKKSDPAVLPYYDVTGPPLPGNKTGKRKGKTIVPAELADTPGFSGPLKFNFVTSAKASDTGTWYGTVLWGFETFHDKKGVAKIKNEYRRFRKYQGETTDEALRLFDEFYQNPGATTAPKK